MPVTVSTEEDIIGRYLYLSVHLAAAHSKFIQLLPWHPWVPLDLFSIFNLDAQFTGVLYKWPCIMLSLKIGHPYKPT